MAVRNESPGASTSRAWLVALALVALFAIALFLRAYWNLDAATEGGQFILSGGSDPYYHKHAVDEIQARGFKTIEHDPLLNYPYGSINPNPPLFEWTIATAGLLLQPFFGGDLATSTWQATLWTAPVFGALTVFPVYFIARALFDDRRVGLVAALLWTISTSAIDASGIGAADHDATIMFFASLAFLFYIQTVRHFRGDGNWVTNWRDGSAIGAGMRTLFRARALGFGYAALTGVSIAAVALTWKGFPYVIGILFAYAGLQMVVDHWKNRDSTGLFLATLVALLVGTLLAYPYYSLTGTTNFVRPVWFIIGAFIVGGLVLVPTRDLPTILVMPAALVAAILGTIVAFFVFPEVANSLLYATVYFKRTALYETIAEAHPASFSDLAFGIGPAVFLLAIFAWFAIAWRVIRTRTARPLLFALVWGAIAFYMATAAIRFLFNAIPVFAVFAAFGVVWVIDWIDFGAIRRSAQANGWGGARKGVRPMHIVGALLVALLLVAPGTLLAADAALPFQKERAIADTTQSEFVKNFMQKRMGAYGQGFIEDYWHDGLTWLDQYDAHIADPAQRPAFLSWWDYGHWAIAIGNHPAVADNFQNGYEFAANFILSQNETHAIQLMAARLVPLLQQAEAERMLGEAGVQDTRAAYDALVNWRYVEEMDMAESVAFLSAVEEKTGKKIRYFAADVRMMPLDDPSTPDLDYGSSIYYAPVTLKGDNPDDYVPVKISVGSQSLTRDEFEDLVRENPTSLITPSAEHLEFTEKFYNSMFYRAYVGTPPSGQTPTRGDAVIQALNNQRPGAGLTHFRLVYATPALKILEYTPGVKVTGTVTEEGTPIPGATLTAFDDAGRMLLENLFTNAQGQFGPEAFDVPHGSATTDESGRFELIAPFSMEGGNVTVVAMKDGVELARSSFVAPRDQVGTPRTLDLVVQRGSLEGLVFEDKDGNGAYNASVDALATGVTLTVAGQDVTTDAEGRYRVDGVSAGIQNVTVQADAFEVSPRSRMVRVQPGETATHDVALDPKAATVTGRVYADANENGAFDEGEAVGLRTVDFAPDASVASNGAVAVREATDAGGEYAAELRPGAYTVTATYQAPDGTQYSATEPLVVAAGESTMLDLRLVKSA
ncbi:MAG TPA: carboxypeptidase regulatory-like domain-containing protein [Candidatus Thermoplasmatota archaeon]|nr:carboxypeptidase regulatory-like domain-containing protein [Candidatus Thermoplasmatota archaeon]